MPSIAFSTNIRTHVDIAPCDIVGDTIHEALENLFTDHPRLKGYLLDDRGAVRKHISIFLDGSSIRDREHLADPLPPDGEIFIMQALSGG